MALASPLYYVGLISQSYASCVTHIWLLALHQTAPETYLDDVLRCVAQALEAIIVATPHKTARRLGSVACQIFWYTGRRSGGRRRPGVHRAKRDRHTDAAGGARHPGHKALVAHGPVRPQV
jgi:hypothetical protein